MGTPSRAAATRCLDALFLLQEANDTKLLSRENASKTYFSLCACVFCGVPRSPHTAALDVDTVPDRTETETSRKGRHAQRCDHCPLAGEALHAVNRHSSTSDLSATASPHCPMMAVTPSAHRNAFSEPVRLAACMLSMPISLL